MRVLNEPSGDFSTYACRIKIADYIIFIWTRDPKVCVWKALNWSSKVRVSTMLLLCTGQFVSRRPMKIAYASVEDPDAAETGMHLLRSCRKQKNRSGKNRKRASKSVMKRRNSCDTKSSLSDASLNENLEGEDKPDAINRGYNLMKANNKESITCFYHFCFAAIGGVPMKMILKAWIKVIHYKKQVTNPYKYGERSKPVWWPPEGCRHMEPDHLHKSG